MASKKLKLYVWEGFSTDYTDGLAFAIAESKEQAEQLVIKHRGYEVFNWGDLTVYPLNTPIAKCVSGGG